MAILDTSMVVPLFDRGHPNHQAAKQSVSAHRIWHVPAGVVAETTQVIRRIAKEQGQDGNRAARRALETLESMAGYRLVQRFDPQLASRFFLTDDGLSYVDAWVVSLAVSQDGPLLTFDQRQQAALKSTL